MSRRSLVFALAAVLTATPALGADTETYSGTLNRVDPTRHTLTLEEMGPWTGAGTGLITRSIGLTPATRIELVRRSKEPVDGGWPGGYVGSPLGLAQLHPGDFVTVKATRHGQQRTAVSIDVVRSPES
jgi:hypothetical protein